MPAADRYRHARPVAELLEELDSIVAQDPIRQESARHARERAAQIAGRLPLVHRTGRPAGSGWQDIFARQLLIGGAAGTRWERERLGLRRAVYFFIGCGAYPHGNVAIFLPCARTLGDSGRFSPFDTGSIEKYLTPGPDAGPWDEEAQHRTLGRYTGVYAEREQFLGPYLAAHFRDPLSYVRCPQRHPPEGGPDFSPYHQLQDANNDRRAWSIEARSYEDVPVPPDEESLMRVVLQDRDLTSELPDGYLRLCAYPLSDTDQQGGFDPFIVRQIEKSLEPPGSAP